MSRSSRAFVGLVAMVLVAAACGGNGSESSDDAAPPAAGEDAQLPDGVVAVVDGHEISQVRFEARFAQVAEVPAVAQQLQGEQGAAAKPLLRAQVLSQLLVSDILLRAAEDEFDIEVTEEDVQARLEEIEDEAGGEEQLEEQLGQTGITKELLVEQELPFAILIEQVQEEVAGEGAEESPPPPPAPGQQQQPSEAELAFQEWALDRFADAEVSVDSEIGTWDPQSGQVQPPRGAGGFPGQPPAPDQPPPPG